MILEVILHQHHMNTITIISLMQTMHKSLKIMAKFHLKGPASTSKSDLSTESEVRPLNLTWLLYFSQTNSSVCDDRCMSFIHEACIKRDIKGTAAL